MGRAGLPMASVPPDPEATTRKFGTVALANFTLLLLFTMRARYTKDAEFYALQDRLISVVLIR